MSITAHLWKLEKLLLKRSVLQLMPSDVFVSKAAVTSCAEQIYCYCFFRFLLLSKLYN